MEVSMVLSREAKKEVEERLSGLRRPVSLAVFTQDIECLACKETRSIAEGLAEMSAKVMVECADFRANGSIVRKYAAERIPAVVVGSKEGAMAHFYGVPSGYIFSSLVEAIRDAANGPALSEESKAWIGSLPSGLKLEAFVSPSDPGCAPMIGLIHRMSLYSPDVLAAAVSLTDFPHLAVKHQVAAIPSVFANGKLVCAEALSEKAFLEKLKQTEK
jgi:alkyl hydroperoxide reductase subunit AhpF